METNARREQHQPNAGASNEVQQVELVDIEDIVPTCGNSLFLSTARALIYMSHRDPLLTRALRICCHIDVSHKSDVALQRELRERMCITLCERGLVYDVTRRRVELSSEFYSATAATGAGITNVYDFVLQVMQLGVNNFAANQLFRRHAFVALGRMLHMNVFYRKSNGQWRQYLIDPNGDVQHRAHDEGVDDDEKQRLLAILRSQSIYLQEFRYDTPTVVRDSQNTHAPISCSRSVRVLLNKRLWLSRQAEHGDNAIICMRFAQFSEREQLDAFTRPSMVAVDTTRIVQLLCQGCVDSDTDDHAVFCKIFCVFIDTITMQLLLNIGGNSGSGTSFKMHIDHNENINGMLCYEEPLKLFEFTAEYNTFGKQLIRFTSEHGPKFVMDYLNFLWGKCVFSEEYVKRRFGVIRGRINATKLSNGRLQTPLTTQKSN